MEREARRFDLGVVLAVAAVIAVVVAVWATGALAAGGSGSSPSNDRPAGVSNAFTQADDGQAQSRDDCPERGGSGRGEQAPPAPDGGSGGDNV